MAFVLSSPVLPQLASTSVTRSPAFRYANVVSPRASLNSFQPSDFEIRRIVGQQSFATITDWEYYVPAPLAPTRTTEPSAPAIRLYDALVISPVPSLYNTRVLLKEFLPSGLSLAMPESEAYAQIYAPTSSDRASLPFATLLGSFRTDESFASASFAASWSRRFPNSPVPPAPDAPFLVFRWEGLRTAQTLAVPPPSAAPSAPDAWFDTLFPRNLLFRQRLYLRTFVLRSLEALVYLHTRAGIVHRSIGLASILLNTTEWREASSLLIKLRDFGFSKPVSALVQGKDLERARRADAITPADIAAFYFAEDIYAMGYAIFELIFSVSAGRPVTQDTLKNLFEDTFNCDPQQITQYCAEDPDWKNAVQLLDDKDAAGWSLLLTMLNAKEEYKSIDLQALQSSAFFEDLN